MCATELMFSRDFHLDALREHLFVKMLTKVKIIKQNGCSDRFYLYLWQLLSTTFTFVYRFNHRTNIAFSPKKGSTIYRL
jgi:hypothetical protein